MDLNNLISGSDTITLSNGTNTETYTETHTDSSPYVENRVAVNRGRVRMSLLGNFNVTSGTYLDFSYILNNPNYSQSFRDTLDTSCPQSISDNLSPAINAQGPEDSEMVVEYQCELPNESNCVACFSECVIL